MTGSERDRGDAAAEWVARTLAFTRRRITGDYRVDDFGYDPELTEHVLLPIVRVLYRDWFRIEVDNLANVPATGGALVVANHSGTLPIDALMLQVAVHDDHPARRSLRLLGADLVYRLPALSHLSRKFGHTLACRADADRLLRAGELVGVFPEGFKGVGKRFDRRYRLQRFGRGGFVSSAIRARVPIVPCAIVGAEEIYPRIADLPALARLLNVPYVPITPTFPWAGPLGLIPLPSRWIIAGLPAVHTDRYPVAAADDPAVVAELTARVRDRIQRAVDELLVRRGHAF